MTVLVPNVYGGGSGGTLDSSSELYKELKKNGAQVGKEVQTYTYWGDKIFTSGPVYFGALVCFPVRPRDVRDPEPYEMVAAGWIGVPDIPCVGT